MSFRFERLALPGMMLVETTLRKDDRGFFQESYRRSAFQEAGIPEEFCQDNFAHSTKGVLRGLHFQHPPEAQGKLVQVTRGAVWDVGVDLRQGSPTFGAWLGVELAEGTGRLLYLPPGFAHGYLVLSEVADLAYKVTTEYAAELDAGVRWDDPRIGVDWPTENPILSPKDMELPFLDEIPSPFRFDDAEVEVEVEGEVEGEVEVEGENR